MRDLFNIIVQGEGYRLAYKIVSDNLKVGNNVIADSCNPINLTRIEWQEVAKDSNSRFINIEVICSNKDEHKKRIETRIYEIKNLIYPTWEDINNREYHSWETNRIIIDTSNKSIEQSFSELSTKINRYLYDL